MRILQHMRSHCAIVCSRITGILNPYNCASVQRALLAPEILNESFVSKVPILYYPIQRFWGPVSVRR